MSGNAGTADINDNEATGKAIWQSTLANLIKGGTYVYILNDDSQTDKDITDTGRRLDTLLKDFKKSLGTPPNFEYVGDPKVKHYDPQDQNAVNTNSKWIKDVLNFIMQ